jgi:hypothetical protein
MRAIVVLCLFAAALAVGEASAATSPRQLVAHARVEWLRDVLASARNGDRAARFASPPAAVLLRRLHRAQALYGFRIVRVRILHPLQRAPVIVIRSDRKRAIARATPRIVELFDPRRPTKANPSGYAYEAYFFVAETSRGVPYLATFNHWRAPHVGGGEWAADESLYPFPHG